jgi:Ras-related protein Rab-8A
MITTEEGHALADELGMKFFETSAKMNEGVEEGFFTLARSGTGTLAFFSYHLINYYRDIKTRLIDSQENAASTPANESVRVNQPAAQSTPGCCS